MADGFRPESSPRYCNVFHPRNHAVRRDREWRGRTCSNNNVVPNLPEFVRPVLPPPSPLPPLPPPYTPLSYPQCSWHNDRPVYGPVMPPPAFANSSLKLAIKQQIEYYFSKDNFVKDYRLRKEMDEQGWIPLSVVATFPMIANKTRDIELILDAIKTSTVVEVQGEKARRLDELVRAAWFPDSNLIVTRPQLPSTLKSGGFSRIGEWNVAVRGDVDPGLTHTPNY